MTKTKSILNRKIEIESVNANANANDWWNKINESDEWQSGIFYALCAAYVLVSLVALVQLVRIQLRLPNYGWTIQKVFHLMNFIVNGLRAILFGLYKRVFLLRPKELEMVLLDLPSLLCFSTYTLLVLFSAEIYHQARSLSTNKLRPAYYIVNAIVYFIQIYVRLSQSHASVRVVICHAQCFPIESRDRQKKLYEVGFVTGIFCTCFLIRCIAVAVSAFEKSADFDVLNNPILHLIYYMFSNFFNPIRRK
ncbi:Tobamovirus multiplication protein 1 [Citrus sinensis]|nr:Tobamovirus multiplication protein 1 [Citrus sinensis]